MQLLFTGLSNAVLQAICQTLIHSLWQGLVAGVLAALIVTFTKRSAAAIRYNLLLAVLLLFALGIGITAVMQLQYRGSNNGAVVTSTMIHSYSPVSSETGGELLKGETVTQNFLERANAWCNEHASIIVLIWLLLFLIRCSQLLASFRYMQRIKQHNNYEVSAYWKDRLLELARKTGTKRTIIFLESELVKIPAVIGYLKPVLLVPAGLLCQLPPEQVEAILLHELAHIRRRDFLINLLQSVIETFFFFNPAITWISSLIREEREACCDDMVIAHIPQKTNYLQALVSFQELRLYPKTGAIALTGHKHYLLNRVKRMLTLENKKLNLMEKTVLILSIVGITAFGFITRQTMESPVPVPAIKTNMVKPVTREPQPIVAAFILKKPVAKQRKPAVLSLPKQDMDTVPKKALQTKGELSFPNISSSSKSDGKTTESQVEATDNEGRHYSIKRVNGEMTSLAVNGTVIPQDKYDEYSEVIGQIDEAQRQRISKRKQDLELRKADRMVKQKEMTEKRKLLAQENRKELNRKMELRKELAKENFSKAGQNRKLLEQKTELRKLEYDQKKAEVMQNQKLYDQKKTEIMQSERLYNLRKAEMIQNPKLYNQRKAQVIQSGKLYRQGRTNDDVSRIIADLGNRNLVTDENDLSFSLSDKELVVNGKKQPAEIHQQFKEKYIQKKGDRFKYSKKGNSTSITINKD
jgi:bla regulator protein blaR1